MTITDNGRVEVDDATLARARELTTDGRMPSNRELQKHLRKRWEVVNAVRMRLVAEAERASQEKRDRMRATMRRLSRRKRPGSVRLVVAERQRTVNEITAPPVIEEPSEPVVEVEPLTVGKHPVDQPVSQPVNDRPRRRPATWPVLVIALPAFAAVWSGWVGLGGLTGFGVIQPFPGIPGLEGVQLDTAITLPIGVEMYGAYALYVWLSGLAPTKVARRFAMWSAFGSLAFGAAGQIAYHRMASMGITVAPWWITTVVSCLPVAVLGMGAALRHLVHAEEVR